MAEEKSIMTTQQKLDVLKLAIQALQAAPGAIMPEKSGEDLAEYLITVTERLGVYLHGGKSSK